jgi:hypothetical protein
VHGSDRATRLAGRSEVSGSKINAAIGRNSAGLERVTDQELKELVAFYKSPLGQKMLKEEPLALDQSMKKAQDWSTSFSEAVLTRIRSEMAKKGHPL